MARPKIPVPTPTVATKKPARPREPLSDQRWAFSFRFFEQLDPYFGLEETNPSWFASFLERLGGLSGEQVHHLWSQKNEDNGLRFHPVNWEAKNIPIKLTDLSWVPSVYLQNSEEYPIMQLMVSTNRGRVVGFFDETWVFNVVLIDRNHNIQPSGGKYGYKVRPTTKVESHHVALLSRMNGLKELACSHGECPFPSVVKDITDGELGGHLVFLHLDDEEAGLVDQLVKTHKLDGAKDLLLHNVIMLTSASPAQPPTA